MKNIYDRIKRLNMFFEKAGSGKYSSGSYDYLIFSELIPLVLELTKDVNSLKKQLNDLQKPNAYWRKNI